MAAIAASREAEIVALADPLEDSVAKAGELVPEAARLRTLEELLEMEIEGLVIATPSALHASQTVSVLSRGIGVFCQKPLGRDVREVSSAIEAFTLSGPRSLMVPMTIESQRIPGRLGLCEQSSMGAAITASRPLSFRKTPIKKFDLAFWHFSSGG